MDDGGATSSVARFTHPLVGDEHDPTKPPPQMSGAAPAPSSPVVCPDKPIRVLVVDQAELLRAGVCAVLDREPSIELVGQSDRVDAAISRFGTARPDVIVLALPLADMSIGRAHAETVGRWPGAAVVALTSEDEAELLAALRAGAAALVLRHARGRDLVDAVVAASRGHASIDPDLATRLLRRLTADPTIAPPPVPKPLTNRELDVLRELASGSTNREIADRLIVSVATVKANLEHIFAKLGVRDRTEAAVRGVELGLVGQPQSRPDDAATGNGRRAEITEA